MKWDLIKEKFSDDGVLVDIYYEHMTTNGWKSLYNWLSTNSDVTSVNCYIPSIDKNLEQLPSDIVRHIDDSGFYCFVSILVCGITIFLRYYDKSELECDVSPSEINSEEKLISLLSVLEKIKEIVGVNSYLICPENCKDGAFLINGKLVS